jgi:hypothetical protein
VTRNQLDGRNQDLNPEIAADSILASPPRAVFEYIILVFFKYFLFKNILK